MTDTPYDLAEYPRINPVFVPVVRTPNEVHFRAGPWSGPMFKIEDKEGTGELGHLIELLDGTHQIDDIIEEFKSEDRDTVASVIRQLQTRSIVRDATERIDDLVAGYLSLQGDIVEKGTERVGTSRLLVVGSGNIARCVVENTLSMGVDQVDFLPTDDDADEWLPASYLDQESLAVSEPGKLREKLRSADFAAFAVDQPRSALIDQFNESAHEIGVPWIAGQLHGFDGIVGPTVYPGETACYQCFTRRKVAVLPQPESATYARAAAESNTKAPLLPASGQIIGGMVAIDLLYQIAGGFGATPGRVIHFDFFDFNVDANDVLRLPHCETCGSASERLDHPRHVTLESLVERINQMD